jgi:hypothetical protein
MKLALVFLLVSSSVYGQDYITVLPTPNPYVPRTTVTITPDGTYHTFQNRTSSTTIGPEGTYQTFRGTNSSVTITPKGETIVTFQSGIQR